MSFFKYTSIKQKLTAIIMLTSIISLITACFAFIYYESKQFQSTMVQEMSSMAYMIGFNSAAPLEFNNSIEGREVLEAFRADPRIILAQTFNAQGKIFASYQTEDAENIIIPEKPKKQGEYFEDGYLSVFKPIIHRQDTIGTIHILMDSREFQRRFNEYVMILFGVALCSSLVAYLASFFLQKTVSKPILHLAETAKRVSNEKDYSIRAERKSNDEVGDLIQRFNQMLSQIQERDEDIIKANDSLEERVILRTQELNLAMEEAEKSNRTKSEFLSRMSHELRTPLNAILGFGQLLDFDQDEPLTDSQKGKVDEILSAGNHLLGLINELLDLARVESGKLLLSLEEINFREVLNEVIAMTTPLANKKGLQIILPETQYADFILVADRIRFKQVLLNLMSNAVKFNRENGSITLEIEDKGTDRITFHIVDTGRGMPKEKLGSLFENFNRLDADSTGVEGTGIGLNITKKLLELMDGTIAVQSSPGEGSRFSIELPKGGNPESSEEKLVIIPSLKTPQTINGENHTLLYVEDNPANLMLVQQILSIHENISLLTATEAQSGIDLAETKHPDLILMDINLPGMDGVAALKHLRENKKTREIPIIAVSADAMQSQIDHAMSAGFDAYITKPIKVDCFLETIDHHLNKNYQKAEA